MPMRLSSFCFGWEKMVWHFGPDPCPSATQFFLYIGQKCRRNLPKSIRCENLPCVRPSVRFFSFYFFLGSLFPTWYLLSSRFQIITWCCCRGSSARHETSGFSSWWTQSVCLSHLFLLFSLSFSTFFFYLFLLFFLSPQHFKGGRKTGKNRLFFTQNSDRRTISP